MMIMDNDGSWISVKKKGSKTEPLIRKDFNEKENDASFNSNQVTGYFKLPSGRKVTRDESHASRCWRLP
jgi:hypothetical protein